MAGEEAQVECEATDRFGNVVDFADGLVAISPSGIGTTVDGRVVSSTLAGDYSVVCPHPGGDLGNGVASRSPVRRRP